MEKCKGRKRWAFYILTGLIATGLAGSGAVAQTGTAPTITISPDLPADIFSDGTASDTANLQQAAAFAWQEFIALNWPAQDGVRDTPDTTKLFSDPSFTGPLVWHTYRHKVETYPGSGNPPGFVDDASQDYGYDARPPVYNYVDGEVQPCTGQEAVAESAWINLDEISQIGLDTMFAGGAPNESQTNNDPKLIRFLAKSNRTEYVYVVEGTTDDPNTNTALWNHSTNYTNLVNNFKAFVNNGAQDVITLTDPVIQFPAGTVEVKSAWRELTEAEQSSGRFYQTTVRYYEKSTTDPDSACYREAVWGMLALHIMHKTPTAPYFIFATFEQSDNILAADGTPVEDENGNIINPPTAPKPTTPGQTYMDGDPPVLTADGSFCDEPGSQLYYQEADLSGLPGGSPPPGQNICVNQRYSSIPATVISVNQAAHDAITAYNTANNIDTSPWLSYKLTNVQWRPFDVTQIDDSAPNGPNNRATFYLSNIVVETDYTLQRFAGRIDSTGPPTSQPANFSAFEAASQTFQNVLRFAQASGTLQGTFNMGGCMGCHGNAQLGGTDFSFILSGGPNVLGPEAPEVTEPGATNPYPEL